VKPGDRREVPQLARRPSRFKATPTGHRPDSRQITPGGCPTLTRMRVPRPPERTLSAVEGGAGAPGDRSSSMG
jgi:hypothetical protein